MSKNETHLDLPALSADESAHSSGNMTDTSMNDHQHALPASEQYKAFTQPLAPSQQFIDHAFFYNLDQLANENPLYFMQQQQQQSRQQTQLEQPNSLFEDQFLKEVTGESSLSEHNHDNNSKSLGASTSTLANSIATTMESFQNAITSSVGEQPPSFWAGLNNFISNVTHNNLFPAFPNIARSFSEYLANHPVPFLSSFSAPTASPVSSPMPSSSLEFDPMLQFKQEHGQSETGLQIRVLGVAQSGAKSRVETQIKLCIQLVTDGGDKAQWWSHLKLPEQMVTKDKLKKTGANVSDHIDPEKLLHLRARVLCASDPSKKVTTCYSCIQRERKRSQRRKHQQNAEDTEDERTDDDSSLASDEQRILLFNCSELVDFSAGDTILPTRITCYCRHHNERLGFCIYFEMMDHTGKKIAEGISPPIMITDDHKSNKIKAGSKRRRAESEALPEPRIPSLSWIKSSLPFSNNNIKSEPSSYVNQFPPSSSPSTNSEMTDIKTVLKSMFTNSVMQQHQQQQQHRQQQQYLYALTSNNANNNNRIAPLAPQPIQPQQSQQAPSSLPPKMKRLIPNEAPTSGGIEITILGTDFRPGMTVMFGDSPATNIQYWSPNTLICTLPPATQPGAVVVSFKESPATDKNNVMVFTYLVETDRALMELALQVVGMKMTGIVEDARKIAMRIVQGNHTNTPNQAFESQNSNAAKEASLSKLMIKAEPSKNHSSH